MVLEGRSCFLPLRGSPAYLNGLIITGVANKFIRSVQAATPKNQWVAAAGDGCGSGGEKSLDKRMTRW